MRKFTIDPARVEKYTTGREALFEISRNTNEEKNEIHRKIYALEQAHKSARHLNGGRWTPPPSDVEKLKALRADLVRATARKEAAHDAANDFGRIADAVSEYAKPRTVTFGGAFIKGFNNGK